MCQSKAVDDYRHVRSVITTLESALSMSVGYTYRTVDTPTEVLRAIEQYIRAAREELIGLAESM